MRRFIVDHDRTDAGGRVGGELRVMRESTVFVETDLGMDDDVITLSMQRGEAFSPGLGAWGSDERSPSPIVHAPGDVEL